MDKLSGRSKGFGFVEMTNDEEAKKAIEQMNSTDFKGRSIKVNEAKPMEKRERGTRKDEYRGNRGRYR